MPQGGTRHWMEAALDDALAASYLEKLGVDARPGDVDAATLAALQRAHLAAVPYENVDILLGRPPAIEPAAAARRILAGRGGYCFHLNGGFSLLLEWLGVDLVRHRAGVWGQSSETPPGPNGNHLGLTATVDGCDWLVDAGLGDGPAEPLPLVAGTYERDGFRFRLGRSPLAPGGWRLDHDPRGSWHLVDIAGERASSPEDFDEMHTVLSTSPDSGFVRVAAVTRRRAGRLEVLRGCVFAEHDGVSRRARDVETADEWWGIVIDHFGLDYRDVAPGSRDGLWTRVRATHEAWDAAGRP